MRWLLFTSDANNRDQFDKNFRAMDKHGSSRATTRVEVVAQLALPTPEVSGSNPSMFSFVTYL